MTLNCLIDLDMFFGYDKYRSPASSLVRGHIGFLILAKILYEAAGRRPVYGVCMLHFLFWQKNLYEAAGRRPVAHKIGSTT